MAGKMIMWSSPLFRWPRLAAGFLFPIASYFFTALYSLHRWPPLRGGGSQRRVLTGGVLSLLPYSLLLLTCLILPPSLGGGSAEAVHTQRGWEEYFHFFPITSYFLPALLARPPARRSRAGPGPRGGPGRFRPPGESGRAGGAALQQAFGGQEHVAVALLGEGVL